MLYLKKMKAKLKRFIILKLNNWLEIDDIKHGLNWDKERIEFLEGFMKAGVDVNMKEPSWAVVCIKGRPEYVQFVQLSPNNAKEVKAFLQHFNRKNAVVDNPFFRC